MSVNICRNLSKLRYVLTLMVVGMEDMKRKLTNATGLKEETFAATRRDAMENMINIMKICSRKYE
jgi:hypothetical protein